MYSYRSPHTAAQKQDDQHERTFSSYVRIQVVVLKTCLGRWTIGRSGERGSGISVLPARYDDDDDIYIYIYIYIYIVGPKREKSKYFKMNMSTKIFIFLGFFSFLHRCRFPTGYFRQRTYIAQGHMNGAPNETRTHSFRFVSRMFFQVLHKLETYTYVRTKLIILLKKYKSLSGPIYFEIYILISINDLFRD